MAEDPPTHLWIPPGRVRSEAIVQRGGGSTFVRRNLGRHGSALLESFRTLGRQIAEKADAGLATEVFLGVSTPQTWPIRTERQHLLNLGLDLVSISPTAPNRGVARTRRANLVDLEEAIRRYATTPTHIGKTNLVGIDEIADVPIAEKLDAAFEGAPERERVECLISLYASLPEAEKLAIAEQLAQSLTSGDRTVRVRHFRNGILSVATRLNRVEMQSVGEQWVSVRSIEPNDEVIAEQSIPGERLPPLIQVDPPICSSPVVVVDSGVNDSSALLRGLVLERRVELPTGSAGPHLEHGTFVASRAIYGDNIDAAAARRRFSPWCPVVDVQVVGVDAVGNKIRPKPDELAAVLERVVPEIAKTARVFNVSLGTSVVQTNSFSTLAKLLDYLARENHVLFVISAGNIDRARSTPPTHFRLPESRLLSPAEALLAMSVGSVAKRTEPGCVAREQEVSPFSRRGPGADEGRKPELVTHGGNSVPLASGWNVSEKTASCGLSRDGASLSYGVGTSYAAPLAAQFAARLFDAYPGATPNLVRALLCHFIDDVVCPVIKPLEKQDLCGFGEPNIQRALHATATSVAFLFQGEIASDNYLFVPFRVPATMAPGGNGRLRLRATMVFDPPVNPDNSVEYSKCRIACALRKRTSVGFREVQVGGEEADLLHPWNPLFHFEKNFRRGFAAGDWEIRLRLMTRGGLADDFKQSFSLVVEVVDVNEKTDVRQDVLGEAPGLFVPVELRIAAAA